LRAAVSCTAKPVATDSPSDRHPPFGRDDRQIISRKPLFQRFFRLDEIRFRHRLYGGGWSGEVVREVFVRSEAAGVLPWDPCLDEVLFIEQFRAGALDYRDNPWCLEIIAGIADKAGEPMQALVRREAREEAGIALGPVIPLPSYLVSPGGSNERMHLFLAIADLSCAGGIHGNPEEDEDIRVLRVPVAELPGLLDARLLDNAPALIAVQWLLANHARLRAQQSLSPG